MKFLKSISLFCLVVFLILIGAYLFFFKTLEYSRAKNVEEFSVVGEVETETIDLAVSTKQNVTTCDTIYEVESYIGDAYVHSVEELPFSFSGLTREELIDEIARYEKSPSFSDKQKGFLSIELLQFHPEKITVRKTYAVEEEKIIYYIKVIDHELQVFRSDMEEAYMPTGITLDMLPEEVQQEIITTKCFNDISEVYAFLESYTS